MDSITLPKAHRSPFTPTSSANVNPPTLPSAASLARASSSLPKAAASDYLASHSALETITHISEDIIPGLNGQSASSRYYGFVTGGVLPVAEWADNVVTSVDQNVQVHLPDQTIATEVESKALEMLFRLLRLDEDDSDDLKASWSGRGGTFTTGATTSNILGLTCGREAVLQKRLDRSSSTTEAATTSSGQSVGELGLLAACARAGVTQIKALTSGGHSSLSKAASIAGLGRASVKQLGRSSEEPWKLDFTRLEEELAEHGTASIIAVSLGEVNTGGFAVSGQQEWLRLRELADRHGAWIHVDGAFGLFARALEDTGEFATLRAYTEGVGLADSITLDAHKILNVPYDCGVFFTRNAATLAAVCVNPNAAYLSSSSASSIPSPLNVGLENSRRFRALPVYAVLHSEGRQGIARLLRNMVRLSRRIAAYLADSLAYELLAGAGNDEPPRSETNEAAPRFDRVSFVVLFRARNPALNESLVAKINETSQMYVSGTVWKGETATRIAVSTWRVDVERDASVVEAILTAVAQGKVFDMSAVQYPDGT